MPSTKEEDVPEPPFEMNDLHTKALLKLLFCHHTDVTLDYDQLSDEIGIGKKTKRWQCGAWKDLKSNGYIGGTSKALQLTPEGVALATTLASDEELAEYKMPETNEEHHSKIKQKLDRNEKSKRYGSKIFQHMVDVYEEDAKTKHELADHFDTLADSHGFFYGFQTLKKMGLIEKAGMAPRSKKRKAKDEDIKKEGKEEDSKGGDNEPPKKKKKVRKSNKCREGGQTWKLSSKAFLVTLRPSSD